MLGELPGEPGHRVAGSSDRLVTLPGLVIYRFGAEISFANADLFQRDVQRLVLNAEPAPRCFVLDAEAINDVDTTELPGVD